MFDSQNTEYLYFDKKGKSCGQDEASLCVIRYLDSNGKIIKETEIEINDSND